MADSPVALLCLPFAGAGASFYQPWHQIAAATAPDLAVSPLQLPGRERLIDETPYSDLHAAADGLVPVALRAAAGRPVAIFGHCLGAILAYELTQRLAELGSVEIAHVFVSASRSPWDRPALVSSEVSDDELLRSINDVTGYRHAALDIPELRELLMPTLRADVRMLEAYEPRHSVSLEIPFTAYHGREDEVVSGDDTRGWAQATRREFVNVEMPGSHMYLVESAGTLLESIRRCIYDG